MPEVSSGALGGLGSVNATVGLTGTEYGGSPAPITEVVLRLPVGTKLTAGDHATCSKQTLEEVGASGCPAGSAAGPVGKVLSIVSFGTERVPEAATLESFYSPEGGLSFFIQGRSPAIVEVAASATIAGNVITLAMPLITTVPGARDVSITELGFRLGETGAEEESSHLQSGLTLPADCAAGKFSWSAAVTVALNGETSTPETDETPAETGCPGTEEPVRRRHEEEASARKRAEEEGAARKRAEEEASARKRAEEEAAVKNKGPSPPKLGHTALAHLATGTVMVRLPGTKRFATLSASQDVPVGSEFDTTHGSVTITVARPNGRTGTATISGGIFLLTQSPTSGLTTFTLTQPLTGCAAVARRAAATASAVHKKKKKGPTTRHITVSETGGGFATRGEYVATSVEGTEWTTSDACGSSTVHVESGVVRVTNLVRHKTSTLRAGKTYTARRR